MTFGPTEWAVSDIAWRKTEDPADLPALIRWMSSENPLWGTSRIHGELLKLGFEVAQSRFADLFWCPRRYSFRNFIISSKNWKRGFSNSTKCVAFAISTFFLTGAWTRSRRRPSRSAGKDQVSKAPAITSVGA